MTERIVWETKCDRMSSYALEDGVIRINYYDEDDSAFICKGMEPIKFCRGRQFGGWYLVVKVIDPVSAQSYDLYDMKDVFGTSSQQDYVVGQLAESGIRFSDGYDVLNFFKALWGSEALPFEVIEEPQETFVRNLRESVDRRNS